MAANLLMGNDLRSKVESGLAIGTFLIEFPVPAAVQAIALGGFDFVVLDLEHSAFGFERLEALVLASHAAGLPAIVRPWASEPGLIGKILDLGASGIMAPHINSAADAERVARASHYGSDGARGFSPLGKYAPLGAPTRELNDATYVIVQIEGQEGLAEAEAIASVPGIDAVFIGPYDLALSLGVEADDPAVAQAAQAVAGRIGGKISLGRYCDDPTQSQVWAEAGFHIQCVRFDGAMFAGAARRVITQTQFLIGNHQGSP